MTAHFGPVGRRRAGHVASSSRTTMRCVAILWTCLAVHGFSPPSPSSLVGLFTTADPTSSLDRRLLSPAPLRSIPPLSMTVRDGTTGAGMDGDDAAPRRGATVDDEAGPAPGGADSKPSVAPSSPSFSRAVQDAAAAFTKESCRLLGTKSVGVDYGLVRTGLAVTVGYNPKPLDILVETNATRVAALVVEVARREQADQVVVGLPLHKNGTEAEQTQLTRTFAAELATMVLRELGPQVPVLLWDERYTSKEAAARAHSRNPHQPLYGTLDAAAACIILENYYHDNGRGAECVTVRDPAMVERYTQEFADRKRRRETQLLDAMSDRDARLQWRREAMKRDQQHSEEAWTGDVVNGDAPTKKKKKRKRK